MFSGSKPFIVLIILLWNTSEVTPSQVYPTPNEIIDRAWEIMGSIRSIRIVKNFNIDGTGMIHASIMKELRSLKDDIHYLEEAASSKLKTVNQTIADVVPRIFREMYYIQDCFETFLQFYETSGKSSQEKTIESVNKILTPMTTSTWKARRVIRNLITNITESGLFEIFEPSMSRSRRFRDSMQQLIYKFFKSLAMSQVKALIITSYAYTTTGFFEESDYELWLRDEKSQLREVLNDMFKTSQRAIHGATQSVFPYHPLTKTDDAYMEVQVFQKYIIPKLDMGSMWSAMFDTCLEFRGAKSDCTSIHCRKESEQKRCKGVLFNCAEISGIADVCYAPLSSERRYNWMKIDEGKIFGHNDSCLTQQRVAPEFRSGLCMCDCEYEEGNINRHFSLGEALSSLSDNKIIIGARLVLRCHVFHIQIKQGKLRENGFVDDDTEWVEIDEVSQSSSPSDLTADKMLHTVTWNKDTIIVGTIMGNPNMILTGLKFGVIDGKLELLIRLTAFDFKTGKLNESITGWSSLDPDAREDAKFMTTNLRSDLGQRTMPLLNKLDVVVDPVTPLIGAGLFVYEDPKRVQYLGLKLIHHSLDMFFWKYLHPPSY